MGLHAIYNWVKCPEVKCIAASRSWRKTTTHSLFPGGNVRVYLHIESEEWDTITSGDWWEHTGFTAVHLCSNHSGWIIDTGGNRAAHTRAQSLFTISPPCPSELGYKGCWLKWTEKKGPTNTSKDGICRQWSPFPFSGGDAALKSANMLVCRAQISTKGWDMTGHTSNIASVPIKCLYRSSELLHLSLPLHHNKNLDTLTYEDLLYLKMHLGLLIVKAISVHRSVFY